MKEFLNQPGFLRTHATILSDFTLILIMITAILFTIGWQMAKQKHLEGHRWIQTLTAILNAVVVLSVMINSFVQHILPGLPGRLFQGSYGVTTLHAFIGLLGLLLGVFVVVRSNILTLQGKAHKSFKTIMRVSYALYMISTLLGIFVYVEAFVIGI